MPFQLEFELSSVRLRGHDHFWDLIRGFGIGGEFTLADICGGSAAHKSSVTDFVLRLTRAGIIERAGTRKVSNPHWNTGGAVEANLYRVLKTPRPTPSLTREGKPGRYGQKRRQMWNIIRGPQGRAGFTSLDIVLLAETDEVTISEATVKEYLRRLEFAGYLKRVAGTHRRAPYRYRLLVSMNTGPLPPKLLKADIVYDQNRRAVYGTVVAKEVIQ